MPTLYRPIRVLLISLSALSLPLLASCSGTQSATSNAAETAQAQTKAPTNAQPGSLDYDKSVFHQLLTDNTKIRRTVRHNPNGVEALTESDDPATIAKIIDHANAMQARMKSGSRVRGWDPVFAELFNNHAQVTITVTPTDKGVKIVESSDDPATVALLRSHAMGVSAMVREGFSVSPNETPRFKVGDPIPLPEVAIGGMKHRILLGQPDVAQLAALKASGVTGIVSFRKPTEQPDFNEQTSAAGTGLMYCNLPYRGEAELTDALIDSARATIKAADGKGEALALHCRTGNRVGPEWAAYRALDKGIPVDQAIAEAKAMQMVDPAMEARARAYIAQHSSK